MTEFSILLLCYQSQILNMIFTTQTQLLTAQKRPITGKLNEGIKICIDHVGYGKRRLNHLLTYFEGNQKED